MIVKWLCVLFVLGLAQGDNQLHSGYGKLMLTIDSNNIRLLPLPDVRQSTVYTCGPSAVQSVLQYYGIIQDSGADWRESEISQACGTDPENGTDPNKMVEFLIHVGLKAELHKEMTIIDLEELVQKGIPVIVLMQAWSDVKNPDWQNDWVDGHYIVAIGFDQTYLYFEDPSLLGQRGRIEKKQFLKRWHDISSDGVIYNQTGITVMGREKRRQILADIN